MQAGVSEYSRIHDRYRGHPVAGTNREDNIERTPDIYFDNWLINRHIHSLPTAQQITTYIRYDYSDVRNVIEHRRQLQRFTIGNKAIVENDKRTGERIFRSSTLAQYADTYCREVQNLDEQLDFINRLWNSSPGTQNYRLRETLRRYVSNSTQIQTAAQNPRLLNQSDVRPGNQTDQDVINLQEIFRLIPATSRSFVVYRVFPTPPPGTFLPEDSHDWRNNTRFMSTSLSKSFASGYVVDYNPADPITERSHLIKIIIPAGNKIIPILNYTKWSYDSEGIHASDTNTSSEFEILLPRFQRLYNLPDNISVCNRTDCRRCELPHYYRITRARHVDKPASDERPELVSAALSSAIERAKIDRINFTTLKEINYFRSPVIIRNLLATSTGTPQLCKGNDIFNLTFEDTTFHSNRMDVHFEDPLADTLIIPVDQVDEGNRYRHCALNTNLRTGRNVPEVSDLLVLLPDETLCPQENTLISLQNGFYLIYKWDTTLSPPNYTYSLFNPKLLDHNHDTFMMRLNHVNPQAQQSGGGGRYLEPGEKIDNPFDLMNEIGMDKNIPLYDKINIILGIKEHIKDEKKYLKINL
jgi:hypothetical protein